VALLAAAVTPVYLVWRAGFTLDGATTWLAIPLLLAEVHGYLTFLGFMIMAWDTRPPTTPEAKEGLSVDFLIPTYNEPFTVLAPTIAGALAVRYPHKTYVLDDGRRPWVRRLCRIVGAEYLTRPNNVGAKAGNLNFALSRTSGEFVAVVDADFVPAPTFLDDTLGFFADPLMAFVQGPQEFYNTESFQHLADDPEQWHEQRVFFTTIQTGKNRWNAAFWCGSPSVLRRTALEDVGGVASETVTEDLHTSLKLHSKGWKSIYQPKVIAKGIAPNNYDGFILQRLRWAQGTMQVIRKEWRGRNLSLAQRLNYVASTGTYFDAVRKAIFLAILPLVAFADALPVSAPAAIFLPFWLAQFGLAFYAMKLLGQGSNRYLMTEFFDLMKMFAFLQATLTLLSGRRVTFKVTPKGSAPANLKMRRVVPFAILASIYCIAIVIGILRVADLGLATAHSVVQMMAVVWCLVILAILTFVVTYGFRKDSRRQADRVDVRISGTYKSTSTDEPQPIELLNLTTTGSAFRTSLPPRVGDVVAISVGQDGCHFTAKVRSARALEVSGPASSEYLVGVSIRGNAVVRSQLASLVAKAIFDQGSKTLKDKAAMQSPMHAVGARAA
jgi:cellulose synthase (UDP-forming)